MKTFLLTTALAGVAAHYAHAHDPTIAFGIGVGWLAATLLGPLIHLPGIYARRYQEPLQ